MNPKRKFCSQESDTNEVSIPGVKNIFSKDSSLVLRIAWIIALLLCTGVSVYQTADAILRYFTYPAVINVEMVRQMNLTLPSITFCPGELVTYLYPDDNFTKSWPPEDSQWLNEEQQFHIKNYNITAKIQYADSLHEVTMKDTEISTFHGVCRLLSYDKPIPYKGSTTFQIFLTSPPDVSEIHNFSGLLSSYIPSLGYNYERSLLFMLKDQSSYPLSHVFMYSTIPLKKAIKHRFGLTATQYKSKIFPNKPCEKDIHSYTQCWDTFTNNEINQIAKCKLPFVPSENLNLTVCDDYDTLMEEYKNVARIYTDSMWNSKASNCLEICDDVHYRLTTLPEIDMTEPDHLQFHLDLSDNIRQIVSKDFGYTVSQMLSDIGGSLGLFLGCSVLSFLEILQIIGFYLNCVKPRRNKNAVNIHEISEK